MNSKILLLFCTSILNFWLAQGIIDGKGASIRDFPFIVEITQDNGDWGCGGSIISNNWVITTIPCVYLEPAEIYSVRAGTDLKDTNGSVHRVNQIIKHENYRVSGGFSENNVALVGVKQPFLFYIYPFPIKLVEADFKLTPGKWTNVTGFGRTFRNSDVDDLHLKLQTVEVPIMSTDSCNAYLVSNNVAKVPKGQFCAAHQNVSGRNACHHDEGGPMVVDGLLAGIISHVPRCSLDEDGVRPVMYIDVSYYRQWVDDKMRDSLKSVDSDYFYSSDRYLYHHRD